MSDTSDGNVFAKMADMLHQAAQRGQIYSGDLPTSYEMIPSPVLDRWLAEHVLDWRIYHYDKAPAASCYWCWLDNDGNGVTPERDTLPETLHDCPALSTTGNGMLLLLGATQESHVRKRA